LTKVAIFRDKPVCQQSTFDVDEFAGRHHQTFDVDEKMHTVTPDIL
jgi:hypothetical protein